MTKSIINVEMYGQELEVVKNVNDKYDVIVGGEIKHPDCTAEAALRALGNYIHGLNYKLEKLNDSNKI